MNIIRFDDAKVITLGGRLAWFWSEPPLIYDIFDGKASMIYLQTNTVLWEKECVSKPKEVWLEVSAALLSHDILCEPLTDPVTSIELPEEGANACDF